MRVIATTAAELDAAIKAAHEAGVPHLYVLFTGAKVDGVSWCGDCVDAAPVLDAAFAKLTSEESDARVRLIEVPLVREEYRGNAGHWARTGRFKLQKIPTLFKVGATGGPTASLVEDQCKSVELVEALLGLE